MSLWKKVINFATVNASMDAWEQRKHAAQIQRTWAKLAFNDEEYNLKEAAFDRTHGDTILARLHEHEAAIDEYWGNRRLRSADTGKPL